MKKTVGIIYYTDNRIDESPIINEVRKTILASGLPIVSCSLKSIDFGKNIVLENHERSYPTMVEQILICLENSTADYVFFNEHDVLYSESHFDFTPPKDNIFYYNENVLRWMLYSDTLITYDRMLPLSCMCANRKFALKHYKMRKRKIEEWGLDEFRSREPRRARIWGYEPGLKLKRRGGLTDDGFDTWKSKYPNIDIRHKWSFSSPKIKLKDFKHKPINWKQINIDNVPGWDLKKIFNL